MTETWPIEDVPDADLLFLRIHKNNIRDACPLSIAFMNHGEGAQEGMSTDWSRYSTPQETLSRVLAARPTWSGGVIQMIVGEVRKIPEQIVQHAPFSDNPAHTNIKGRKETRERYLFMRIWKWAIPYPTSNR